MAFYVYCYKNLMYIWDIYDRSKSCYRFGNADYSNSNSNGNSNITKKTNSNSNSII